MELFDVLQQMYGPLGTSVVMYGHIYHPYTRHLRGLTVANAGSASLALDGDVRATYVIVEDGRIAYDAQRVAADLIRIGYPDAEDKLGGI